MAALDQSSKDSNKVFRSGIIPFKGKVILRTLVL